ncbi:MAG: hypothetical protein S4CHLAM45_10090 [Chlamydiales bacterium]|nr:hypothetical protein [Chlamydiales bacterium]MCH9620175.1 hypothetical protein [Chlamydiales bacterium]MCH9623110.1 hypothetical protein [Chlamydiales bacterium]
MRFVLSVASKYLIPKWRQLSVSIISLVSILVISLVVWLTIVFLSITEGIQQNWLKQLVSLNAPVRMTPTEAYYSSYYYKIDSVSSDAGYTTKSIGEKLFASQSDPYDPNFDAELPSDFPLADCYPDGSLKDPVKAGFTAAQKIGGVRPKEFEVALGNMRLNLIRHTPNRGYEESCISQVSYFTNIDEENHSFSEMVQPPEPEDLNNFMSLLPMQDLPDFFNHIDLKGVKTKDESCPFSSTLHPYNGNLKGCGIVNNGEILRVIIPQKTSELQPLCDRYKEMGYHVVESNLHFDGGVLDSEYPYVTFDKGVEFKATLIDASMDQALSYHDLLFQVEGEVQGVFLSGNLPMNHLQIIDADIADDSPFWAYKSQVPVDSILGDGIIISQNYRKNGIRLGDRGYLSYFAATPTSTQEQRLPIFVAGFYDPGLVSFGHKFAFVDPKVTTSLRGSLSAPDQTLGNGVNLWIADVNDAHKVKQELVSQLDKLGLGKYWEVESYHDYDFVQPILQQLSSDKTLFSLVAFLILLVACSNIISMLILLVNDKKKEIGIMRAMGATSKNIASIFGICGFIMGIISCLLGTVLAIFTVHHIEFLVSMLNFFKGHEMFQTAFFGAKLPSTVSWASVIFVLATTLVLSIIAGLVPALKAARLNPTETLRGE